MRHSCLLALAALALSCGGITNKLCGAPGQPCCANAVCDANALCGAGDLCEACGNEGEKCCTSGCGDALTCMGNTCTRALTCMTSCTLGEQRCANNGIETCTAAGVCPTWTSTLPACPGGSVCTPSGATVDCVESCPGACTVDSRLCTNEGLRVCVASGACPTLMPEADDTDVPTCLTGGVVSAELSWESPTPFGQAIVDIGGELRGSYWVLDDLGNIVRYALGPWEYELRATPGKRMKKLASCGLGSILYAAGEGGTVFRRSGGTWTEQNVGSTTLLTDIACDSTRAFAAGSDGKLYIRSGGTWTGYATGFTSGFNAIAWLFGRQQVYLAGNEGLLVKCEAATLPPTCVTETSGTTKDLLALSADTFSDTVWAAGKEGTLLERGASWSSISLPTVTSHLVGLTNFFDQSGNVPIVVAVSESGTAVIRRGALAPEVVQVPDSTLTNVWVPDQDTLVLTGLRGALWYRNGLFSQAPFTARGGRKPLTADLNAVTSVGNGRLFAVGSDGARVRRQNGVWSVDALGASTTETLRSIAARNANEVYAVGDSGTVLVRRYGTWVADAVGLTTESLQAVVLDTNKVWVLGQTKLFEKNFQSGVWRAIALPPGAQLSTLALKKDAQGKASELVVAGAQCATWTVGLTDDSFTAGPSCNTRYILTTAAFSGTGDLYVASNEGTIYRRTGTTMTFENVAGLRIDPFLGLIADGSTMWVVGSEGALFRRVAGNWSDAAPDVTTADLRAGVKDDEGLFLVGVGGVVLRRL